MQDLFFKLSKLQRYAIVAAICGLLLVGFYFLFIDDMRAVIAAKEQALKKLGTEIANQEAIKKEGPKLKAKILELKERLETMVASLPEKQDIESLLKTITDLVSETNLVHTRFVPQAEKINEELYYAEIPITLTVRGDYAKLVNFLSRLNSLPRIVNVPSFKSAGGSTGGGAGGREKSLAQAYDVILLDIEINGVTYRRLSEEEGKTISLKKAGAAKGGAGGTRPAPKAGAAKGGGKAPAPAGGE